MAHLIPFPTELTKSVASDVLSVSRLITLAGCYTDSSSFRNFDNEYQYYTETQKHYHNHFNKLYANQVKNLLSLNFYITKTILDLT